MADVPSVPSWMAEDVTRGRSEWTRPRRSALSDPSKEARRLREENKRVKVIYEDEGMEYGEDADEKTIVDRFSVATRIRRTRIEDVFAAIRRARNVEICFLIDATGSMSSHIAGVRESIQEIVRKLTAPEANTAKEMKLSVVAYRDYGDQKRLEQLNFTESESNFKSFLAGLVATGGGDGPEDVFGGLDAALKLNWSANAGTKVIFHIGDAPCHGNEFHANIPDSYPGGDPAGLKHTTLFALLRENGIQYYFGKITSHTDIMLGKFAEAYGEPILDFDVKKVEDIRDSVVAAVNHSISTSISTSHRTGGIVRKERDYIIDKVEPKWTLSPVFNGKFISYDLPESIQAIEDDIPLERNKPKSASVKIAPHPFAKGAERVAFYAMDVSSYVDVPPKKATDADIKYKSEEIVLKEYLHVGKGMNSSKRYELSNQMQTIASYLAAKFVDDLEDHTGMAKTIKFIKIRTLALEIGGKAPRYMSAERRFDKDDRFIRFTNNAGYAIMKEKALALGISQDFVELVMAFSHWTYKATRRFLMVVDLEGVVGKVGRDGTEGVVLTDPAIHCEDITRYGPMNHGIRGIDNFFLNHTCNKYCRELGLESYLPRPIR